MNESFILPESDECVPPFFIRAFTLFFLYKAFLSLELSRGGWMRYGG
jgi:hypothetical protein